MKKLTAKRWIVISVSALFLILIIILLGYQISKYPEIQMKIAYIEQHCPNSDIRPDQLEIESYGTYDGCTVAFIHGPFIYLQALMEERVGHYTFYYDDSQRLWAYKDGEYKSMPDAYAAGWLNEKAVKEILTKQRQNKADDMCG